MTQFFFGFTIGLVVGAAIVVVVALSADWDDWQGPWPDRKRKE